MDNQTSFEEKTNDLIDQINGSLNDVNQSLSKISTDQKDLKKNFSLFSLEINSISANASCDQIAGFNVTEDGDFMVSLFRPSESYYI